MARRPALLTQAEVARAIRAARQAGAACIEIKPDGSILVHLSPQSALSTAPDLSNAIPEREIVL